MRLCWPGVGKWMPLGKNSRLYPNTEAIGNNGTCLLNGRGLWRLLRQEQCVCKEKYHLQMRFRQSQERRRFFARSAAMIHALVDQDVSISAVMDLIRECGSHNTSGLRKGGGM